MKAIVCSSYGRPDVLELAEVEKPALADDLVLVKVRAASVNPADWYGVAGPADRPPLDRLVQAEERPDGSRLRGHGRSGRQGRHARRPRRRRVRGEERRARRVRDGPRRGRGEAGEHHLRGGGGRAGGGDHGPSGPSGQGAAAGRPASPDQRRVGRRRHVRGPDREGARCGGHGGVQHAERRAGSLARRRPCRRLHARGLHPQRPALRPAPRRRRQQVVVAAQACADTGSNRRHRRSAEAESVRARSATSSDCGCRRCCAAARRPCSSSPRRTGPTWRFCESCSRPGR